MQNDNSKLKFLFLIAAILIYSITGAKIIQAGMEDGIRSVHLDEDTVKKGYPVASLDGVLTLYVTPSTVADPVDITIQKIATTQTFFVYAFTMNMQGKQVLLRKPLAAAVVIQATTTPPRYARAYYYHTPQKKWLALSSFYDASKGRLTSSAIDFTEGVIGVFWGEVPQPDRIDDATLYMSIANENSVNTKEKKSDFFEITLHDDIIEKGYTIEWNSFSLAILPKMLQTKSHVIIKQNDDGEIDFNITSLSEGKSPMVSGALIPLVFTRAQDDVHEYVVVFWDNNAKSFRPLPTMRKNQSFIAKTPFSFGKYKLEKKEDVYVGKASWFSDALILKTRYAAASNDYEIGTMVSVTNMANNASVDVEILSTGPFVAGRIIDLTKTAFSQLASPGTGIITVRVEKREE